MLKKSFVITHSMMLKHGQALILFRHFLYYAVVKFTNFQNVSHSDNETPQTIALNFSTEPARAPPAFTKPRPTWPGQGKRGGLGGNGPLATLRVTHTARPSMTVCLLPRFRKVVALSTSPDGKENEWRRKLKKKKPWMHIQNKELRWEDIEVYVYKNSREMTHSSTEWSRIHSWREEMRLRPSPQKNCLSTRWRQCHA